MAANINAAWASAKRFGETSAPARLQWGGAQEDIIYTASGQHITLDEGVPTLNDITQGLAFQCRFQGQVRRYYPHLCHVQVVADLLPREWELFGLLQDAAKACTGDWNPTFQTEDVRFIGEHLQRRILWERFGLPAVEWPEGLQEALKLADERATAAESRVLGNPTVASWDRILSQARAQDPQADACVQKYLDKYLLQDFFMRRGGAIRDYEMRVEAAWQRWKTQQGV